MPAPHDPASLRRVIGLFAYYSKWIRSFSTKIHPLSHNTSFSMSQSAVEAFEGLKEEIKVAAVSSIDPDIPFVIETNASDVAIAATSNQAGRAVAFFSRSLNSAESKLHLVEKEAYTIVESIKA